MLEIIIPDRTDEYDEQREEFITIPGGKLILEHSLISISKWEAKWKVPFLKSDEKTVEQTIDYIKCMTVNSNVRPDIYYMLTADNLRTINDYIHDPMTATTFNEIAGGGSKANQRIMSSELIYYYMVAYQIPVEFE